MRGLTHTHFNARLTSLGGHVGSCTSYTWSDGSAPTSRPIVGAYATDSLEVVEWRMSGTQLGEFDGIAPARRRFVVRGVTLLHVRDDRVIRWQLMVPPRAPVLS